MPTRRHSRTGLAGESVDALSRAIRRVFSQLGFCRKTINPDALELVLVGNREIDRLGRPALVAPSGGHVSVPIEPANGPRDHGCSGKAEPDSASQQKEPKIDPPLEQSGRETNDEYEGYPHRCHQ